MDKNKLIIEKQSLLDWISKIKENKHDIEDYYLIEYLNDRVKEIMRELNEE